MFENGEPRVRISALGRKSSFTTPPTSVLAQYTADWAASVRTTRKELREQTGLQMHSKNHLGWGVGRLRNRAERMSGRERAGTLFYTFQVTVFPRTRPSARSRAGSDIKKKIVSRLVFVQSKSKVFGH